MAFYQLKTLQRLPIGLDEAWDFFSSPANLKQITPSHMGFDITSGYAAGDKMHEGMIITYKVKPVLGIPLNWMTEITHIHDKVYFVDEQRFGPYDLWHHQHWFKAIDGGVEMQDIVNYKIPFGFLGDIANSIFVRKQLKGIFDYRFNKLEQMFGKL
jgi:ligand-binding SRPBCC domain-containing protein